MSSIRINLNAVANGSGGQGNSIRKDAFKRVLIKLLQPLPIVSENTDYRSRRPVALDVMANRRHDAILVSARRGDGKTTFLTDLLALVQRDQLDGTALQEELGLELPKNSCRLYSLGIVDPTLVENKQNIVVIIIQKIKEAIDRQYELTSPGEGAKYDDLKSSLHALASGLTLLDGIGEDSAYGKEWADPDYILETGLDRAKAASAFERTFHKYVEKACDFVKRDAFILAIDDVDTWFERGWPVLEALRKYLATPRLKIVMAGDMNLYSLLVRQRQWKQITKEFVDIEANSTNGAPRRGHIEKMVDTLQDQYLIKIAPPENRIDLKPLQFYTENNSISLYSSALGSKEIPEAEFVRSYAKTIFALTARDDRNLIRNVLLRLPLRSSLQALSGAWELIANPETASAPHRQDALDALRYIASTWLTSLDLDASAVRDATPDRIFGILSQWMSERKLWETMPRFQPDGSDDGSNLVAIFVAATLVDLFGKHPRLMIDYWVRVCTLRELVDAQMADSADMGPLMQHLKIGSNERTLQFASRLASWDTSGSGSSGRQLSRGTRLSGASVPATRLREPKSVLYELYGITGSPSQKTVFFSTFDGNNKADKDKLLEAIAAPLRAYHRGLIDGGWSYGSSSKRLGLPWSLANSLESLRNQLDPDTVLVLGLGAMQVTSGQQSINGIYSFLRILSFISELMELAEGGKVLRENIEVLLARHSQVRSYPSSNEIQAEGQDDDVAAEDEGTSAPSPGERIDGQRPIADMLGEWLVSISPDVRRATLAPVTLARIWTRFTYASTNVRAKLRHLRSRYLGVLMHRTIVAFLHAVGVESLRAAGETLDPKMVDNPIETNEAFLSLLDGIEKLKNSNPDKYEENLLWFNIMFSCPIWSYFLAREDDQVFQYVPRTFGTKKLFDTYTKAMEERLKFNYSAKSHLFHPNDKKIFAEFDGLYAILNSVQLQGQQPARLNDTNSKSAVTVALRDLGATDEELTTPPKASPTRTRASVAKSS